MRLLALGKQAVQQGLAHWEGGDTDRIAAISLEAQARPKTKLHAANLGRL